MSLLVELGSEPQVPQWRHWTVGVEPIGRITLPAGARHLLGTEVLVQAVSRERMLVLRRGGVGANLPIDRRGRLVLPAWFRGVTRSSGSVLVSGRSAPSPTVVLAGTGLLEDLVSHVAEEAR
jgi:DNA-binding transcriptional regulator/RsmH inhibitor MraZ